MEQSDTYRTAFLKGYIEGIKQRIKFDQETLNEAEKVLKFAIEDSELKKKLRRRKK